MKRALLIASLLFLAACNGRETLPDPRAEFPTPTGVLMEQPEKLRTIPLPAEAAIDTP